jgi:2'-5' RNA ligase
MSNTHASKYTIVGFLEHTKTNQSFSENDWPLHVTLLDPFKTTWKLQELCKEIQYLAMATTHFQLKPIKRSFLGPNKDVPVTLLELDENMYRHHADLLALGRRGAFVYNTPEFVGDGFVPHITDTADKQAGLDENYMLETISIVNTIPNGDLSRREIMATFDLVAKMK